MASPPRQNRVPLGSRVYLMVTTNDHSRVDNDFKNKNERNADYKDRNAGSMFVFGSPHSGCPVHTRELSYIEVDRRSAAVAVVAISFRLCVPCEAGHPLTLLSSA